MKVVFHPTRWTLVQRTRGQGEQAKAALSELCAIYYQPVFSFVKHRLGREDEARDLTHAFFEDLLQRASIGAADPAKGRFRSYLLGAVKHFLLKRHHHELTVKRGGGAEHVAFDPVDAAVGDEPDDVHFDRDWAFALIRRAHDELRREMVSVGKGKQFDVLHPWLAGGIPGSLAQAGEILELTPNALNVAIHRFRQRFLKLVRAEVEATALHADDVAGEFRHLVEVLAKG